MHNSSQNAAIHPPKSRVASREDAGREPVIAVESLAKEYRVYDKPEGLLASISGLFQRKSRIVHALRGVNLSVGRGGFV